MSNDVKEFLCIGQLLKELGFQRLQTVGVGDFAVGLVTYVKSIDGAVGLCANSGGGDVEVQIGQGSCDAIEKASFIGGEHIDDGVAVGDVVFHADFDIRTDSGLSAPRPPFPVTVEEIAYGRLPIENVDELLIKACLPDLFDVGCAVGAGYLKSIYNDAVGARVGLCAEDAQVVRGEDTADLRKSKWAVAGTDDDFGEKPRSGESDGRAAVEFLDHLQMAGNLFLAAGFGMSADTYNGK